MRVVPGIALLLYCLWPAAVRAESEFGEAYDRCMSEAVSTVDMRKCSQAAYELWDKKLNENYQKAMRSGSEEDGKILRDAQRAWLAYRDKMVRALNGPLSCGGTMDALIVDGFVLSLTRDQALYLLGNGSVEEE